MSYEIDTIQYGEYKDTKKHLTIEELACDMNNIATMETIEILEIRKNGARISDLDQAIRIIQNMTYEKNPEFCPLCNHPNIAYGQDDGVLWCPHCVMLLTQAKR